jgi:hypothetical protein
MPKLKVQYRQQKPAKPCTDFMQSGKISQANQSAAAPARSGKTFHRAAEKWSKSAAAA